jgi:hypothetical protein
MLGIRDDLDAWIGILRDRLARGELATLDPIDIGYGTTILPARIMIAIMLTDLDELDEPATDWDADGHRLERRRALLEEFRRLRALID